MLVPHCGENPKFGEGRLTPDQGENALIFIRLETVLSHEFRRDGDIVLHDATLRRTRLGKAVEEPAPINAANEIFDEIFRMWHHAQHVELV